MNYNEFKKMMTEIRETFPKLREQASPQRIVYWLIDTIISAHLWDDNTDTPKFNDAQMVILISNTVNQWLRTPTQNST